MNRPYEFRKHIFALRRLLIRLLSATAMLGSVFAISSGFPAYAQTLESALVRAYQYNPVLNAERARQRGADENVSIALSGYRPQINAQFSPV